MMLFAPLFPSKFATFERPANFSSNDSFVENVAHFSASNSSINARRRGFWRHSRNGSNDSMGFPRRRLRSCKLWRLEKRSLLISPFSRPGVPLLIMIKRANRTSPPHSIRSVSPLTDSSSRDWKPTKNDDGSPSIFRTLFRSTMKRIRHWHLLFPKFVLNIF